MTPKYLLCPRCDGKGTISVLRSYTYIDEVTGEKASKKMKIEGDCMRCHGTGEASLFDTMGEKRHEQHREEG